jgi:hypothetical protein
MSIDGMQDVAASKISVPYAEGKRDFLQVKIATYP